MLQHLELYLGINAFAKMVILILEQLITVPNNAN